MANGINTEKSIGTVINELKFELREFVQTRLQILREEMKTKTSLLKIAVPMFAIALVLAAVGFLLLTGLFVVLIASAFSGVLERYHGRGPSAAHR